MERGEGLMPYFTAILHMKKPELNQEYRPVHIKYLDELMLI